MADDQNPNRMMNIDLNFPPLDNPSTEVHVEPRFPSPTNGDAKKNNLVQQQQQGGSLFDCIICMELAKEPVVTCCGHLFCWPCLYRWLNRPSSASQCPICKGEVTVTNVTPIYGHDGNNNSNSKVDNGGNTKNVVPVRPKARRIERARRDFPVGQQGSSDEWFELDWIDDVMFERGIDFTDYVDSNYADYSEFFDTYTFTDNMDFNL